MPADYTMITRGDNKTEAHFDNAKDAGAAFHRVPAPERPAVIESVESPGPNEHRGARIMAEAVESNGTLIKRLPDPERGGAANAEFIAGYANEAKRHAAGAATTGKATAVRELTPDQLYKQHPDMKAEAAVIAAAQTFGKEKIVNSDSRVKFNWAIRNEIADRVAYERPMKEINMQDIEAPQQPRQDAAER